MTDVCELYIALHTIVSSLVLHVIGQLRLGRRVLIASEPKVKIKSIDDHIDQPVRRRPDSVTSFIATVDETRDELDEFY